MYRTSIKKHNVKVVSEEPYTVKELPTKWEVLEEYGSLGLREYGSESLLRALEKGEITAVKIEWIDK